MSNELVNIDEILQITQNTAINVNGLSQQMGVMANKLAGMDSRVSTLESDFNSFKNNEILTSAQRRHIPKAVKSRVAHLLKIKWVKGNVASECIDTYTRYYKGFVARLYSDAKNNSKMADDYRDTRRVDYDEVMEYIAAWYPASGIEEHKHYLDKLHASAESNQIMKVA